MSGKEFKDELNGYGLGVSKFLDLKEEWERLSAEDRYLLVKEVYDSEKNMDR